MRGTRPLQSKVVLRFHQAATEILLPDPIDHHPRGERIRFAGEPFRQTDPVAGPGLVPRREHLGDIGSDLRPLPQKVAPHMHERLARLAPLLHHQRGHKLRLGRLERRHLGQLRILLLGFRQRFVIVGQLFQVGRGPHPHIEIDRVGDQPGQLLPHLGLLLDLRFPGIEVLLKLLLLRQERLVELLDLLPQFIPLRLRVRGDLLGRGDLQFRFVAGVEHRKQLVVLALRDGVVLVVMALGAAHGKSQKHRARRRHPVTHRFHTELFRVGPALFVDERIAVEPGGDLLFEARIFEQVTRELFEDELIVRQVAIDGVDHPVAVLPDVAGRVDREPVRIGVPGRIEPMPSPALAIVGRGEQLVDEPVIGFGCDLGRRLGQPGFHLGRGG